MTLLELVKMLEGILLNLPKDFKRCINKFSMNSKEITLGDAFITYGKGYMYIDEAIKNGAIIIITDKYIYNKNICIIKVNDIEKAILKILGYIKNVYSYIPMIMITGSVGKTSTKELLSDILSSKYNVLKNEGNLNNYLGIAKTLFKLNDTYDFIVLEVGMNHKGEIEKIVKMLKPDMSVITNVSASHIGNLGSLKEILKAKMEIVSTNSKLITRVKKIKYDNIDRCLDIKVKSVKLRDTLSFNLFYQNKKYLVNFKVPNKAYINSIILVFKICTYYDIDLDNVINIINDFKPLKGRMNVIKKGNYIIIDDTYNASYESVKSALGYLNLFKKKMVIFGDIKELGKYSIKIHKKINKLFKNIKYRNTLLVGEYTKYIDGIHFDNIDELIYYLSVLNLDGYTILVKASRAMHMEKVIEYLNR